MKKSILALALAFGVTTAFAQDLTSKKGEPILPEAGDWGLGIDADPFLTYAQGIFGKSSNTANPTWNFFTNNQTITGRYFSDEKTVYRGAIRLGFTSNTVKNYVTQDISGTPANPPAMVLDSRKTSTTGIGISAGIEKRKGKTRLQGYYGGEVGIWFGGSSHSKYTYGNAASTTTNGLNPTSSDFNSPAAGGGYNTLASGLGRTTDSKSGSSIGFGLRGFVGAEYFFMPKMSIGGEFGWGITFLKTGDGQTTKEELTTSGTSTQQNVYKTGGTSKFGIDTDNLGTVFGNAATLRFNMYF